MLRTIVGLGRPGADTPFRVGSVQAAVLETIRDHPETAHGVGVARRLRSRLDPDLADAQVYTAIRRLEARGMIETIGFEEPTAKTTPSVRTRGRPRKLLALTTSGRRALEDWDANLASSRTGAGRRKDADEKAPQTVAPVVA